MPYTKAPRWLIEMPKPEIHCHMGGSMRKSTVLELASNYNVRLPAKNEEELEKLIVYKNRKEKSLSSYLDAIKICESVLVKPEAFQRAAFEISEDVKKENGNLFELRFGPTNYANGKLKLYEIVEATLDGLKKAEEELGIYTGLIICGIRTDLNATKIAAEIAANYHQKGVIGFDLAGRERGFRPELFAEIIIPVLKNFIPVTIHAGEDDNVASIADALIHLNADRLGQVVSLRESTDIIDYLSRTRKGIEICMTSNIDTGVVSSYQSHPVRNYFFSDGLRLSINTDNRTTSGTTLTKEYMILINELGFKKKDILKIAKDGIKSSFLKDYKKKELLRKFDTYSRKILPDIDIYQ